MRILITGGSGRIGKHIVQYLLNNPENQLWLLQRSFCQTNKVNYLPIDLTKEISLEVEHLSMKYDLVIHMAALTHVQDNQCVGQINYAITKNLIDFLLIENRNTPLIFFSTVDVYGIRNQNFPINVRSECKPSSFYGLAKLQSEHLLLQKLKAVKILRIAPMIEYEGLEDLHKRVYIPGTKIQFMSPYNKENSFSDIQSICRALNLKIEKDSLIIQNVTNGKIYTEQDILNSKAYILKIPKFLLDMTFLILGKTSTQWAYSIEHKLHKLFKTNTYV